MIAGVIDRVGGPVIGVAALDLVALFSFGVTWTGVVFGLIGKTPAGANSLALTFQMPLPSTSSAFVRTLGVCSQSGEGGSRRRGQPAHEFAPKRLRRRRPLARTAAVALPRGRRALHRLNG